MIPIKNREAVAAMRESCRIAATVLARMRELVAPGLSTYDLDQEARWGFSVGVSQTLFDGLRTKGSIQRATAGRRAQERALDAQRLQVALDIRESLLALKNAAEGIRSAREGVSLAEESARLQKALYESGGGTLLEWNNAQVELTRAKVAVVEAEASYHLAEAALERAVGGPIR